MNSKFWAVLFFALFGNQIYGQSFTLSGFVKDSTSGETLKGAIVKNVTDNQSAVTNNYGFFSLSLKNGTQTIEVSAGDFESQTRTINVITDIEWNVFSISTTG